MRKLKFDFLPKLHRFQIWKQIILAGLLIIAVLFLYDGYSHSRKSALNNYSSRQLLYANQIANDIGFRFDLLNNVLQQWSKSPGIVVLTDDGKRAMEQLLEVHGSYISGVTRMDENGIIMYTVPFSESAIGADISYQTHIRQLLDTHLPVLSDAFMTVQGYWAVAYHMPIMDKSGNFRGSLAFLIPFREIFRVLFLQLLPGEEMTPWVLGADGRILYSMYEEQEGQHYSEPFADDSGIIEVASAAISGRAGYMVSEFRTYFEDYDSPVSILSTILPFQFHETTWVLILSIPEKITMRNLSGMSNRWLVGMIAILVLALFYSTLKLRTRISSTQAKKWKDVARLRDVLAWTINQAREAIIILNEKQEILYANPAAVELTGFAEKYRSINILDIQFQEITPSIEEVRNAVIRNGNWTGRIKGKYKNDHNFNIDISVSSVFDSDGNVSNFIIIGRDVIEQAIMERRLREQQKMEAIGQLAGGVAHDFNNLLIGISGYAELLKERYPDDHDISDAADVILNAVHRGSELTKQLLGYARQGKHRIESVCLATCIRYVESLLKRTLDQRIKIRLDLEEGVFVNGDSSQLEQVILNLAVNARDAMPEGGSLEFTLRRARIPKSVAGKDSEDTDLEFAVLTASDNGIGISPDDRKRIFEPYFTTKNEEGTGMGLATVYGIVTNHEGIVEVDSIPGKGTTFTIYLPLNSSTAAVKDKSADEYHIHSTSGTVLIIDDEIIVVEALKELLSEIGYDVITVPGGKRALEIFTSDHGRIDAVILDLSMPEMDGKDCFLRLREIDPEVRVVLVTGFGKAGRVQEMLDLGVNAFLQKPFRLKEIAFILKELIDS